MDYLLARRLHNGVDHGAGGEDEDVGAAAAVAATSAPTSSVTDAGSIAAPAVSASGIVSGSPTAGSASTGGFCKSSTVMQNGFTSAFKSGGICTQWLFQDAVLSTHGRYAGAVIGTILLAFAGEALRYCRALALSDRYPFHKTSKLPSVARDGLMALTYGLQMLISYWLMMITMTYDILLFVAVLFGVTAGYFVFNRLESGRRSATPLSCACSTTAVHGKVVYDSNTTQSPSGSQRTPPAMISDKAQV